MDPPIHRLLQGSHHSASCQPLPLKLFELHNRFADSNGVGHSSIFTLKGSRGAIVVLLEPGRQYFITGHTLRRYIYEHYISWCDFARHAGFDLTVEDIIFVSGWVKTSRWALSTISHTKSEAISLRLSSQGFSGPTFTLASTKGVPVSVDQRFGPQRSMPQRIPSPNTDIVRSSTLSQDQTIFLRYYKVKRRGAGMKGHGKEETQSITNTTVVASCLTFRCRLSPFRSRFRDKGVIEEGPYERVSHRASVPERF